MECRCSRLDILESCDSVEQGGECSDPNGIRVLFTREMLEPSLCPNCYRRREECIFNLFENKISWATHRITCLEGILKKAATGGERSNIEDAIEEHKHALDHEIEVRTKRLKEFRDSQGIWGDG